MGRFSKKLPAFDIIPPVGGGAHRKGLARQAAVLCHGGEKFFRFHTAEKESNVSGARGEGLEFRFAVNKIDVQDPEFLTPPVEKIYGGA